MSLRQMFPGSIVKPGFNPLAAQTPSYTYYLNTWGANQYGQLGLGNLTYKSSPNQVGNLTDWLMASSTYSSVGATKTDGTLWMWGKNSNGQLGTGNTTYYSSPKQIGALTNWLQVSAGAYTTLAVKTNGTIWSWGNSSFGQNGLGNTTTYSSPKQIGALTNWASCVTAVYNSAAIKTDGTLWTWGYGGSGTNGLNNLTNYSSPKQVGALTNWSKIYGGQAFFWMAIKTDGTLWAWGSNGYGELGLGDTTYRSSPVQVGALTNWSKAACGNQGYPHTVSVKTNGTLWTWGRGDYGPLGLGNTTSYSSPKQVGALTNWLTPGAGRITSFCVKTDGTLWDWGFNSSGQLGQGGASNVYSSPKQVGSLTTWYQPFAGYYSAGALSY